MASVWSIKPDGAYGGRTDLAVKALRFDIARSRSASSLKRASHDKATRERLCLTCDRTEAEKLLAECSRAGTLVHSKGSTDTNKRLALVNMSGSLTRGRRHTLVYQGRLWGTYQNGLNCNKLQPLNQQASFRRKCAHVEIPILSMLCRAMVMS